MVKLVAEGKSFDVPEELPNITPYFKDVQEFEGAKDEIVLNTITAADLTRVFEANKIAAYKYNEVQKVTSSDSRAYIGEALTAFFSKLSCKNYFYSRCRTQQSL